MKRNTYSLALVALVAFAPTGCAKGKSEMLSVAPPAPRQNRWTTYDAGNFTVDGPENMKLSKPVPIAPNLSGMIGGTEEGPKAPPPPKERETIEPKSEGQVFMLYDHNYRPLPGEPYTTLKITRTPGYTKLSEAAEEVRSGQDAPSYESLTLPVGKAAKVVSKQIRMNGDEETRVYYILVHDGDMYKFTFETIQGLESLTLYSDPMMQTFRIK